MSVAVVSANFGDFEKSITHEPQSIETFNYCITEQNFPLRYNSMTPRLQARIVKTHMWQFALGHNYYLWIDSSCKLSNKDSVKWFLEQLEDADIAVFKHPRRDTVQEEADYLKKRLKLETEGKKKKYILPRYENEDIDGQLKEVDPAAELYASTAFIYKNSLGVRTAMKLWWYHISRYHVIDQLALPHCIKDLRVSIIQENYLKCDYIEAVRK